MPIEPSAATDVPSGPPAHLVAVRPAADQQVLLRPGRPDDAAACGRICYEAFRTIAAQHGFPADFPDCGAAETLLRTALSDAGVHLVVAERDGQVVGSNMAWELSPITGVGPITIAPEAQDASLGRRLMHHVLERAEQRGALGVRLVQAAYHNRSLALYSSLGFDAVEPLSVLQGPALGIAIAGRAARPAVKGDLQACADLGTALHGFSRAGELSRAIADGVAMVVEREGRINGYCTGIGFLAHAVGRSNEDVMALIGAAPAFGGPGFLLPTRNARLLRWCLSRGLRLVQPMTLMKKGFYRQPKGAYLPSVLF